MPFGIAPNHQKKLDDIYPKYRPYDRNIESSLYYSSGNSSFNTSSLCFLEPPHLPNASNLSLFIYYINYKPHKIPKVMKYFERRVERDISREDFNAVLVGLEICKAIILLCSHNFGLFYEHILAIIYVSIKTSVMEIVRNGLDAFGQLCRIGRQTDAFYRFTSNEKILSRNFDAMTRYYSLVETANNIVFGLSNTTETNLVVAGMALREALLSDRSPCTDCMIKVYLSDQCLNVLVRQGVAPLDGKRIAFGSQIFEALVEESDDELKLRTLVNYILQFMETTVSKYYRDFHSEDPPLLWVLLIDRFPQKYLHVMFNCIVDYSWKEPVQRIVDSHSNPVRSICFYVDQYFEAKLFPGVLYRLLRTVYLMVRSDEIVVSLSLVMKKYLIDAVSYFDQFQRVAHQGRRLDSFAVLDETLDQFLQDPHFRLLSSIVSSIASNEAILRLHLGPRIHLYLLSLLYARKGVVIDSSDDPVWTLAFKCIITHAVYISEKRNGKWNCRQKQVPSTKLMVLLLNEMLGPVSVTRNLATVLLIHLLGL